MTNTELTPESHAVDLLRRAVTEAKRVTEEALRQVENVAHLAHADDVSAWLNSAIAHLGGAFDAAHQVAPGRLAGEEAPPQSDLNAPNPVQVPADISQGLSEPVMPAETPAAEAAPEEAPEGDEKTEGESSGTP